MSKGKEIFQAVCDAPDLAEAVKSLPGNQWLKLYGYLLRSYDENGVSGRVLAVMLLVATTRYAQSLKTGTREKVRKALG